MQARRRSRSSRRFAKSRALASPKPKRSSRARPSRSRKASPKTKPRASRRSSKKPARKSKSSNLFEIAVKIGRDRNVSLIFLSPASVESIRKEQPDAKTQFPEKRRKKDPRIKQCVNLRSHEQRCGVQ